VAKEYLVRLFSRGPFLVDGFVRGALKFARKDSAVSLLIEPFGSLSKLDTSAVADEDACFLGFAEGEERSERSALLPERGKHTPQDSLRRHTLKAKGCSDVRLARR
jgi:hypothetical protein